jgi:cell division protein FtsB
VATASDRDTVTIITATNAKVTSQLETLQAHVQKLKEEIAQLKLKIKPAWQSQ